MSWVFFKIPDKYVACEADYAEYVYRYRTENTESIGIKTVNADAFGVNGTYGL